MYLFLETQYFSADVSHKVKEEYTGLRITMTQLGVLKKDMLKIKKSIAELEQELDRVEIANISYDDQINVMLINEDAILVSGSELKETII